MKCDNCKTAIGYNLLMQWSNDTIHAEDFTHPCPFCPATLYIHVEIEVIFQLTTFLESQYLPREPY